MNQTIIIGIVISVIFGSAAFLASNNFIVGIICLILPFLYFLLFANKMIQRYQTKITRFRECYHFVNNYVVSLSIKNSVSASFDSTLEAMPDSFKDSIENIDAFSHQEKLEHLSSYFRFHVYSLFIDLINLYEEQGGNILDMSRHLLDEVRLIDEYIFASETIARKRIIEFSILWFLTIVIMVTMRFALSQFFSTISKQVFFPIGVGAIVLFALASIHIAIMKMCRLKIKGWDEHEKV